MMKLLLINTINPEEGIESLYPPLGLGYISSYLKKNKKNIQIKIIDKNIHDSLIKFKPDVVGISSVTQNFERAKRIARLCKKNKFFVVMGGVHISLIPESLNEDMSLGIIGEAEETFLDIIDWFENGKNDSLNKINGVVYNENGKLIITPPRSLINPLDRLPMPDRESLGVKIGEELDVISSRGCPYSCKFCSSSKFWEKTRFFSAEYVLQEVKQILEKYKPYRINFFDDLFIADKERLKMMTELIENNGINKRLQFTISARANLIDQETVSLLKRMNVTIVNLGLESGSEKILQYLKGTNISVEDSKRAIKLLKGAHIETSASFIMGAPPETKEDLQETYNFIRNSKLDLFEMYLLIPFPKTEIWDYALKKGLVSNNMNWNKLNFNFSNGFQDSIILNEYMSREELWGAYQLFMKERRRRYRWLMIKSLYRRPKQLIPFIKKTIEFKNVKKEKNKKG